MLLNTLVTRILPIEHGNHRDPDDGPNLRKVELAASAEGQFAIFLPTSVTDVKFQPLGAQ